MFTSTINRLFKSFESLIRQTKLNIPFHFRTKICETIEMLNDTLLSSSRGKSKVVAQDILLEDIREEESQLEDEIITGGDIFDISKNQENINMTKSKVIFNKKTYQDLETKISEKMDLELEYKEKIIRQELLVKQLRNLQTEISKFAEDKKIIMEKNIFLTKLFSIYSEIKRFSFKVTQEWELNDKTNSTMIAYQRRVDQICKDIIRDENGREKDKLALEGGHEMLIEEKIDFLSKQLFSYKNDLKGYKKTFMNAGGQSKY